jgi:protein-tyrosine phosphatase
MAAPRAPDGGPLVLIVCTGNLCRSPLVEALLRGALTDGGIGAEVVSAGIGAPTGAQPERRLLRVAGELGLDLADHRSTPLSRQHLRDADLILTMTGEHAAVVGAVDPEAARRTVTLRTAAWRAQVLGGRPTAFAEWVAALTVDGMGGTRVDPAADVTDPTGGTLREYRAMADEVSGLVRAIAAHWGGR